ncbi:MAG: ABC transporter permease [Phycisphaerales bacterium]|nr:MAG: ABC transporter permease [Phycisphaerales bacterium]
MGTLWQDIRIAYRSLAKQPTFSVMIVFILAIGIAGTTTIFSLFNGLFLRPLPIPNEARVMNLHELDTVSSKERGPSYGRFHAWREHNRTFESMGFSTVWVANVSANSTAERIGTRLADREFFDVLGIRPILGRCFTADEDRPGGPNVVLLSAGLWTRLFGRDPNVIGRTICLDGDPSHTVVGILPDDTFPDHKDVWCPLRADPDKGHGGLGPMAVGRLKREVTAEQARDDLTHIQRGWAQQHPEKNVTTVPRIMPLRDAYLRQVHDVRLALTIVLAVVTLVLLVACCNVSSTMLARGVYRKREIAMRAALGATSGRLIQQVLAESLVLSLVGGLAGAFLSLPGLRLLLILLADAVPTWMRFTPDFRFVPFIALILSLTTLLSGLLPALHAAFPKRLYAVLHASGTWATASGARHRTLGAIVVAQIAVAAMLLTGAGLMLRTFLRVQNTDSGFRTTGVLTYHVPLSIGAYIDENKRHAFWERHLEAIQALPGAVHAALINNPPMSMPAVRAFESEGQPSTSDEQDTPVLVRRITPDYFKTLGIPLLGGRGFMANDNRLDSEPTVIVNKTLAERFWPGENPLDKRIRQQGSEGWFRVIGIVGDITQINLEQSPQPGVYLPRVTDAAFGMYAVIRTTGDPLALVPAVRGIVRSQDSGVPIENVQSMSERVQESTWPRRLALWLYGLPAVVAGILAFAGIYGVTSYAVSQRTQEIGIRVALGAGMPNVLLMVISQGLRLALIGLAVGGLGGFALSRLLASIPGMLHDVSPTDPATFLLVMFLLAGATLAASYLPARRATKIDPMVALRYE